MITKPTLLLDAIRCKANIGRMVEKAQKAGVKLRPHFKTHQSLAVGEWFKAAGVHQATVSSLTMAKYFADGGWSDITVAFPVNILEIDTIKDLARRIQLNLLVVEPSTISFLQQHLEASVGIFIKVDTGYHRTGVPFEDFDTIDEMVQQLQKASKLEFKGFLHHAGHSYYARSRAAIAAVHEESLANMNVVFQRYQAQFPALEASVGDTPTCSVMEDFGCATEIRPGNFAFYDLMMVQIGACSYHQIAVAVACPVVAKHPERNEVMVYGGGVHFSKDAIQEEHRKYYGVVVKNDGQLGWTSPEEGAFLSKISQEHGTISASDEWIQSVEVGDVVKILPVHSCMTADLLKKYLTTDGTWLDMMRAF